jgi:serine/threonine protein kinase/Tfp pilus assembly protein PilF
VDKLLARDRAPNGSFDKIAAGVATAWMLESEHPELIGQSFDRYEIVALLGSGGMGEVYLAHDKRLDRKVAIKFLPRQFTQNAERLRRFEQEARSASALNHPNIITIHEIGECDGIHFIAMEYVDGETLRDHMHESKPPVAETLEIGIQTAGALVAAHDAGIVHRDIKPANIMLRRDGYIKVLDFGLAKLSSASAAQDVTDPGRVMGTTHYMSPEQALGKKLDHRTDIFSLGAVLYEMAAGHRAFEGDTDAAVYNGILNNTPPPLTNFSAGLPAQFDQVIGRALEKDPDKRYQSASDLREDLKRLAQGSGWTEAASVASMRPRHRSVRLNWRYAALAALVMASLSGFWLWQWTTKSLPGYKKVLPSAAGETVPAKSIAVLPFENLSAEKQNEYFANGVQDEILTNLAKIADLKVISRTSVMQYRTQAPRNLRKIGEDLGVAHVLEGSVQRANGRVRVNAQLIDARTDAHLWAETYDRDLADIFKIQTEIARAIANQLHAKLSPSEKNAIETPPTADVAAFDLYSRARTLALAVSFSAVGRKSLLQAVELLDQAVVRDPSFVAAYCQLANTHDQLYFFAGTEHTPERLAAAETALQAALRLRPEAGEVHLARAEHLYRGYLDYDGALFELATASHTVPNDARISELRGYIMRRQGKHEEALACLQRAIEIDPRNFFTLQQIGLGYAFLHRYTESVSVLDRALGIEPDDIDIQIARAGVIFEWKADPRPLHNVITSIQAKDPLALERIADSWFLCALAERDALGAKAALAALGENTFGDDAIEFTTRFGEGLLARALKDEERARAAFAAARLEQEKVVQAKPNYGPALCVLGLIDAGLGRKEDALQEGRRAIELMPVTKDAVNGERMVEYFAIIAAWVEEKDLALQQLTGALSHPINTCTYGRLKLFPWWDPLRGDPRFEKIVASLAPK